MDIAIVVLVIILLVIMIINLVATKKIKGQDNINIQKDMQNQTQTILDRISKESSMLMQENLKNQKASEQEIIRLLADGHIKQMEMSNKALGENKEAQISIQNALIEMLNKNLQEIKEQYEKEKNNTNELKESIQRQLSEMIQKNKESQMEIVESNQKGQNKLSDTMLEAMNNIRKTNEEKLNDINKSVSEKLDKSLNERLDQNFQQIGERLGALYQSLGELNKLSSGVTDLNKTLSNVKTRGVWGEIQLQSILEDTMTPSQYETNIAIKKNSDDRVEFAVNIPSKDDDKEMVLLPIDSKFPSDIFNKIVAASEEGDAANVVAATKELEQRIKGEARTIRDKYIDPPKTTDFAIMFLPTESLYSEVLRINGLNEWCQTNCKVVISGPTTITALLNSLRVGFSNLTLNKKTKEVIKTLQAVKAQYNTMDELIDKTQKKLSEAIGSTDKLKHRNQMIQSKMKNIDTIDIEESQRVLGIVETATDEE